MTETDRLYKILIEHKNRKGYMPNKIFISKWRMDALRDECSEKRLVQFKEIKLSTFMGVKLEII